MSLCESERIVKRARRLGTYLFVAAILWTAFLVLNMIVTTPVVLRGGPVPHRNLLRMGPSVLQLLTPCHLPLLGSYPDRPYVAFGYAFSICQMLVAILIARRALELRYLRNYRGCWRAATLAAIPFVGLWIGMPCWILCVYVLAFLWRPEVKKAFDKEVVCVHTNV